MSEIEKIVMIVGQIVLIIIVGYLIFKQLGFLY